MITKLIGKKLVATTLLEMSSIELRTVEAVLAGQTIKEIAWQENVSIAAISARISRAMKRNGYTNKTQFFVDCEKLRRQ